MLRHRPVLVALQCIIISSELGVLLSCRVFHWKCRPLIAMAINLSRCIASPSIACFVSLHCIIVASLLRHFVVLHCVIFVSASRLPSSCCNGRCHCICVSSAIVSLHGCSTLHATLVPNAILLVVALALFVGCYPHCITIALSTIPLFVTAIIIRRMLSLFVIAHHRGHVVALSALSHQPPPAFVDTIAGWLFFAFSIAIALIAIACLSALLPLLLPPLLLPSSSHATLVVNAMARVALALFVDRYPHCRHHCPCHPCPLRCCHHHPPHTLVVCRCPLSWSCGCLVNALSPAIACLHCSRCWLIVMIIQCFQNQGIHQQGGQRRHIGEPVKSALLLAGWCIHGELTSEPTCGDLMVGEAGTRISYHSSGGALLAGHHPSLQALAMVGCCVLC
jgi:hypothetical protein